MRPRREAAASQGLVQNAEHPQWGLDMEPSGGRGDLVRVFPAYSHCFSSRSLPCPHLLVDSIKKQCFYAINLLRAVCRQF